LPGAEVAVLRPLYDALQKVGQDDAEPVVIVDWGGLKDVLGPYQRAEDLLRYEEGLRLAGLPV
jgi:hypothetical protein